MKIALILTSILAVVAIAVAASLGVLLINEIDDDDAPEAQVLVSDSQVAWCWDHSADVMAAANALDIRFADAGWSFYVGLQQYVADWDGGLEALIETNVEARIGFSDWIAEKGYGPTEDDETYDFKTAVREDGEIRTVCLAAWGAEFGDPMQPAPSDQADPWWEAPEAIAAFIAALTVGLIGGGIAFLQHGLDGRREGKAARNVERAEAIRLGTQADILLVSVLRKLLDQPLHELGHQNDRRRAWDAVDDDLASSITLIAELGVLYAAPKSRLENACASIAGTFGRIQRFGRAIAYGSKDDAVAVQREYGLALGAAMEVLQEFADAWALEYGVDSGSGQAVTTEDPSEAVTMPLDGPE